MKKQSTKKLFIIGLVVSIISSSLTVFATTNAKPIRAALDPNFRYTLNNQSILPNQSTIIYKGKAYAPIDTLANVLGYNVSIRNNQIAITTPTAIKPVPPTVAPDSVTIPRAEIIAIDFAAKEVTIVPAGKSNTSANQVVLRITAQTTITDGRTKKAYSITDLNTSIPVKVVHSAAMTKSIPPQTNAISITLL